jgi:hypothetical protein
MSPHLSGAHFQCLHLLGHALQVLCSRSRCSSALQDLRSSEVSLQQLIRSSSSAAAHLPVRASPSKGWIGGGQTSCNLESTLAAVRASPLPFACIRSSVFALPRFASLLCLAAAAHLFCRNFCNPPFFLHVHATFSGLLGLSPLSDGTESPHWDSGLGPRTGAPRTESIVAFVDSRLQLPTLTLSSEWSSSA